VGDAGTIGRVFVASSTEALDLAKLVASTLYYSHGVECTLWTEAFTPGEFVLAEVQRAALEHRFAVFLMQADDVLTIRGHTGPVPRTNVVGEYFLFVGRNGRSRSILLAPAEPLDLPSDLHGVADVRYDRAAVACDPHRAFVEPCAKIAAHVRRVAAEDARQRKLVLSRAMQRAHFRNLTELRDSAGLLRDLLDAVQRETLDGVLDEKRFAATKRKASARLGEISTAQEARADELRLGGEYRAVRDAIASAIEALPFPSDLPSVARDVNRIIDSTALGALPEIRAAWEAKDLVRLGRLVAKLPERVGPDDAARAAAELLDARLRALRQNYVDWWNRCSTRVRGALEGLDRGVSGRLVEVAASAIDELEARDDEPRGLE
jgi:hypothetical protein